MAKRAFENASEYVGVEFESRQEGPSTRLVVLELGLEEYWVEDNDGARWSIRLDDLDRWWTPYVPDPKVGELWTRRLPYAGACEVLSVADGYVVYTYDGRHVNPMGARTLENFKKCYVKT